MKFTKYQRWRLLSPCPLETPPHTHTHTPGGPPVGPLTLLLESCLSSEGGYVAMATSASGDGKSRAGTHNIRSSVSSMLENGSLKLQRCSDSPRPARRHQRRCWTGDVHPADADIVSRDGKPPCRFLPPPAKRPRGSSKYFPSRRSPSSPWPVGKRLESVHRSRLAPTTVLPDRRSEVTAHGRVALSHLTLPVCKNTSFLVLYAPQ